VYHITKHLTTTNKDNNKDNKILNTKEDNSFIHLMSYLFC